MATPTTWQQQAAPTPPACPPQRRRAVVDASEQRLTGRLARWVMPLKLAAAAMVMALTAGAAQAFDLQFKSVTDVDPAPTSGVLQYTVQIENSGFTAATDVRTVFAIPDGASVEGGALALPAVASASCSTSGAFVVCTHGDMQGTGSGAGTPPIVFTLKFRAPSALPSPPDVRLRGAIGRGAPPLGSAQAHPAAFFASGSPFWAGDTNENNNTSAAPSPLQQTTLENNADLSVAVVASANPVVSGSRLTYTVSVTNNGPTSNPTTGVRVLSTLPAGATYVSGSAAGAGWSFSGPSGGVLTATRGALSLAVGATVTFTFEVTVGIASGTLTHNAEVDTDRGVGGALLDNIASNNTASLATGITPSADLALTKTVLTGSGPFVAGSTLVFRLAPRNGGLSAATSVVVRDVLPTLHTLAPAFPLPPSTQAFGSYTCRTNAANQDDADQADAGRAARSILRCTRATLPVGDTENIDISVVTDGTLSGSTGNTASITAATADPALSNNSSTVNYTVLPDGADVELLSYNKSPSRVAATGGLIANSIRVRNNGPRAVNGNLQVFVSLGAGETLVSTGSGWSCVAEAGGMRCTFTGSYPVASGAASESTGFPLLSFVTQAGAVGTLNSDACVGGSGGSAEPTVTGTPPGNVTDFNTGNDCSGTRGVAATNQVSDLVVSKTTNTPSGGDKVMGASENSATFTITVTNQGPTSTPGVLLQDYLPGHVNGATVVSICGYSGAGSCTPPATANFPAVIGGWTCTLAAERLVCDSGAAVLGVGAPNAQTFVVQMSGRLRDSLSTAAFGSCSSNGQFCNQASVDIDSGRAGSSVDPDINNNIGQDTLVVHAAANIQTESKTFSPAQAQVGIDTEYTVNYRNPATSRSDLPAVLSPGAGVPAGVVFVDTFNLGANDAGFVLRSATIVTGAACTVAATTGGVVAAVAAGGTSYSSIGGAAGTVRVECPAVTMPRNTDRQVRIVVRPNIGALGPLQNTASFRIVDSGNNTVSASGATYDFNTDSSAGDDTKTASVNFVVGQVDLRVENSDLQDPAPWAAAAVATSPGGSDIVYRVQVRNGGPSLATNVRLDYTITPPPNGVLRFIGDEAGTAVTMASGATAPQRCAVLTGTNPVVAPATLTLRCTTPGFGFTPNIDGVVVQGTQVDDGAFLNLRLRFESTPSPIGSTVSTLAVVSAAETELNSTNNEESEETTVRTTADLALSKTGFTVAVPALPAALPAAVNTVGLGQPFNWVVDLVNNGPGDSLSVDRTGSNPLSGNGTVITDTLPAGVTVTGPISWQKIGSSGFPGAAATGSGTCTLLGLAVTCNVGDVGNGGRVRVTLPVRWDTWPGGAGVLSDPQTNNAAASSQTTDPVGGNNSTTHVVRLMRSSLAGVVFEDRDRTGANSGTQQSPAADPPLAGVTVVLRAAGGVDAYGIAFALRTTTSDGNGAYQFSDLPAATYEIVQAQPAGFGNSPGDPTAAATGTSPSLAGTYVATGADPAGAPLPAGANSRYTGVVLGTQQDGVRYNFPEVATAPPTSAPISGLVFVDTNRDGSPGAGEPGIAGITLGLYPAGTTCPASGALPGGALQTVSTDSTGAYSFSVGVPGTAYVICQQQNAGYGDRTPQPGAGNSTPGANQINVAALGTAGSLGNHFPEVLAALAGQVFADFGGTNPAQANNGVRDAGEPGIGSATANAGVPITLSGTPTAGPAAGTAVSVSTTTAADGSYSFANLYPGSYTVTQGAIPAGLGSYTDGINTAGPVAGGGSAGTAGAVGDNAIRGIVLAAGAQGTGNHFAELPPAAGTAPISGLVFVDSNRDGSAGAGEPGIAGITLGLYPAGTTCPASGALPAGALQTVTTDSVGAYSFNAGVVGTPYVICQQQGGGLGDRSPQPGAGNSTPAANQINVPALGSGGSAGNQFPEVLASLAGQVFADYSLASPALANNGLRDAGEVGIGSATAGAGVPITLTGTASAGPAAGTPLTRLTHTAADGSYAFADLYPGTYTLTQGAIPAPLGSYTDGINTAGPVAGGGSAGTAGAVGDNAIRGIVLAAGAQGTGNNFAEQPPAAGTAPISGLVFVDSNRDGSAGAGEPGIAGITLGLYPAGTTCPASGALPAGALQTVTTDSVGAYSFNAGVVGTPYVICQQQGGGLGDRLPQPGAGNTTPAANQINVPALGSGGSAGNQFPEVLASLAGQVFADYSLASPALANNGLRDAGEVGIGSATAGAGVPITLTGTATAGPAAGTPLTRLTHTAADGSYAFADLYPGTYTLTQGAIPAPLGSYTDGINTAGPVAGGGSAGTAGAVGDNTIRGIVLAEGAQGSGNNFAELPPAVRIAGLVYVDANRDGSLGAADTVRISGVTLRLFAGVACTGTVLGSANTDTNGAYSFSSASLTAPNVLIPGAAYSLCQTQPAAYDDGSVNPGGGAAAGAANHIVINALPATGSLDNLFGEVTPVAVPAPDLVVSKVLAPATFTENNRGRYTVTVRNVGNLASSGVYTVTDTLPAGITAVAAAGSGWTCSVAGQAVSCTSSAVIAAGSAAASTIALDVQVGPGVCTAGYPCSLANVVSVTGGGEPPAAQPTAGELANPPLCTSPATQNACRLPTPIQQSGGVSGFVWLDADHDRRFTAGTDQRLTGFIVELFQGGTLLRTATTDSLGQYQMLGLVPGSDYELRFRDAATGAYYGRPVSTDPAGGNDPRANGAAGVVPGASLSGFSVPGGNAVRINQNLPLDPNGVVYDSQSRQPVAGALVELLGPGGQLVPAQCVLGGVNSVTTSTGGAVAASGTVPGGYAFWLLAPTPQGCPGDGSYTLRVTPPAGYLNAGVASSGSLTATSNLIPAQPGAVQVPASCQAYAAGAPCAVQNQATAPSSTQATPYFFAVPLAPSSLAGFVDIVNNHIPLDPLLGTRFVISKQASRASVEVGDAVGYTITVKHLGGVALGDVRVDDRLPAGFRYVPGTFKIGATLRADPAGAPGPNLRFDVGALPVNGTVTFTYVTRAGVGAQQGDGINTAQAVAGNGATAVQSNVAKARVRITGGVFGAEACVVGKVYVDCNNNQVQDREELGIPGVRLVLQDGTNITSDSEGKYSLCGLPPRTHVLKADLLTLPRGSRLVTSSSRNAGDANSIFIDLKNGDLQRADFIEGSCSNTVLEQVKARRTQGEVRAVETEKKGGPALKFEGKAPGYPPQGTDSANQQPAVRPREAAPAPRPPVKEGLHEQNVPVPELPAASGNTQRQPTGGRP